MILLINKPYFWQGLRIEDSLPNDIYTEIAKRFAFCRYNQDFSTLRPFLLENVKLIIYKHKERSGIADFESYWIDKEKRLKHDCINVRTSIKFCNYYSHVAVYDQIEGYKPMYVLFRVKDDIVPMWCVRQTHYKIQQLGIGVLNGYRLRMAISWIMCRNKYRVSPKDFLA